MHLPVSELFNYNVDRNGSLFSNCSDGTGEFGALLLQEYLNLQARVSAKEGGAGGGKGGISQTDGHQQGFQGSYFHGRASHVFPDDDIG